MLYAFIAALVVVAVLAIALYYQVKAAKEQTADGKQLLDDYQRRVNEQQKLLDDYRALEKNFDSIGQGYEQALLLYDQMEENSQKLQTANEALQKRVEELQATNTKLSAGNQQKEAVMQKILTDLQPVVAQSADLQLAAQVCRLLDLNDLTPDLPPMQRNDNVLVADLAKRAAEAAGVEKVQYLKFDLQVPDDAAAMMILTNQLGVTRVITHLLTNALKFTTDGTIKLAAAVDMNDMKVTYTVEDSGMGVPAGETEHIFEPYVKLNQYFDGDGIGLTVARNIARRLGGDLVLDTAFAGPGARFVLTLPM